MSLAILKIGHLRSIGAAELELDPGINLIYGANGSGKTSVLEAAFLVGRGRSFRTRHTEALISRGEAALQIFAQTRAPAHRIGFEYRRDEAYAARLDGEDVRSLAELPGAFFVEAIDPEVHRLVEGAPGERRRWLDWGVFHVEPRFLETWLRFSRALRQRNAALKQDQDPRTWNAEVAHHGEEVARARGDWFASVKSLVAETARALAGVELEISYSRGWSTDRSLLEALTDGLERDRARGSTLAGPHRADIHLRVGGRAARDSLSRGQQKLVASALVLALLQRLRQGAVVPPTLLLDDPAAELDGLRLGLLVELVAQLECQLVITSLDPRLSQFGAPARVFHVEQGVVRGVR